ncbi:hypothetical protein [Spirulina major]|uniref:hypothetical protein n=1 Tax=Spirulina major TaxID=270636 RepID=UPI001114BC55|nr:hypothetical protein [Spirulina major]
MASSAPDPATLRPAAELNTAPTVAPWDESPSAAALQSSTPQPPVPAWMEVSFWGDRLMAMPADLSPSERRELEALRAELGPLLNAPVASEVAPASESIAPSATASRSRLEHSPIATQPEPTPEMTPDFELIPLQFPWARAKTPAIPAATLMEESAQELNSEAGEQPIDAGVSAIASGLIAAEAFSFWPAKTKTKEITPNPAEVDREFEITIPSPDPDAIDPSPLDGLDAGDPIPVKPSPLNPDANADGVGDLFQGLQLAIVAVGNPIIPADGRSTLPLEGTITTATGERFTESLTVTLTTSAGEFLGGDFDEDAPGFQVEAVDGNFKALLRSTLETQRVQIRAAVLDLVEQLGGETERDRTSAELPLVPDSESPVLEAYTQAQFTTNLRPSLVSGVVSFRVGPRATNFWGSRRDFLHPDYLDDVTVDVDASVFAIGRSGDWLFTGAMNSDRPLNETCDGISRLFRGPQHCEQDYPVYGDSSTVDYLTPSMDNYYLRLERTPDTPGAEPDYLMWGDYHTTEFARSSQTFTANTRQLNGFKGNYNFGNVQISGFYSGNVNGFQRDTIAPDGTSGYYFLSHRLVIPGSENIFIEQASLEQPGLVQERQAMQRGPDYEIDYDRGTILFRRPIERLNSDLFGDDLLQQIVVTYQYEGTEDENTNIFAGRAQYNFSRDYNRPSWLATSYWQEDMGDREFELYGADLNLPLGKDGSLIAEYAYSDITVGTSQVTGAAYRLKLTKKINDPLTINAHYHSVERGFANEATTSFQPGQTRYGLSLNARLDETTGATVSYDYEANFGTSLAIADNLDLFDSNTVTTVQPIGNTPLDNETRTFRVGLSKKIGTVNTSYELVNRNRTDSLNPDLNSNASQFIANLLAPLTNTLTFRAKHELAMGTADPIYPNRTTVGLNWAVAPGIDLRLAHQFMNGGLFGDNSITRIDTVATRKLWGNTDITSRYSVIGGINGWMGQGAVGLRHQWVIEPGLRLNLGYERVLNDLFGTTAAGRRTAQAVAMGQTAASLGFFGGESYNAALEYTANANFRASARVERRVSSAGENLVLGAAATGKITPALTTLFRFEQASAANGLLEALPDTVSLKLGLAYRPPESDRFNALFSYEYRRNPSSIPETLLFGTGTQSRDHTLAMEAIYAPDWRWEFYGKYALRHSQTDLAQNFSNSSAIHLGQMRVTRRLGYHYDAVLEGRVIGQPDAGYTELGAAVELGYYLSPDLRFGIGYSFGSVRDRDFSGYRSDGGLYFGVTMKVNELLRGFGRQRPVARPPEESS